MLSIINFTISFVAFSFFDTLAQTFEYYFNLAFVETFSLPNGGRRAQRNSSTIMIFEGKIATFHADTFVTNFEEVDHDLPRLLDLLH